MIISAHFMEVMIIFAHFMTVTAQIIRLDKPAGPIAQQLLPYLGVTWECVAAGRVVSRAELFGSSRVSGKGRT